MEKKKLKLGLRAHDFGRFSDFDSLGNTVSSALPGGSIQLAVKKILKSPPSEITRDFAQACCRSLEQSGISIAVLGCYINPVHPDEDIRQSQLNAFKQHLMLAQAFGCPYVGTETGSVNPDCSHSDDSYTEAVFSEFLSSVEQLLETARDENSYVAIEPVAWSHTIDTAQRMRRVLDEFKTPWLKVIYDPVNLMPRAGFSDEEKEHSFYREALSLLGPWVVAVHCKDYVMTGGVKKGDLPAGEGLMDWSYQASLLSEFGIEAPVLLENHQPSILPHTLDYIRSAFSPYYSWKSE